jgi:hypothetical protein
MEGSFQITTAGHEDRPYYCVLNIGEGLLQLGFRLLLRRNWPRGLWRGSFIAWRECWKRLVDGRDGWSCRRRHSGLLFIVEIQWAGSRWGLWVLLSRGLHCQYMKRIPQKADSAYRGICWLLAVRHGVPRLLQTSQGSYLHCKRRTRKYIKSARQKDT